MRSAIVAVLLAAAPGPDVWAPVRPLLGTWEGTAQGEPGNGTVRREYRFALGGRFIEAHNTSRYPPQEKNPKGEVHEDAGYLSWDRARKLFVLRQFHAEGFVNTYAGGPKGGAVVLTSEAIENIPPGWRARETWTFPKDGEMIEVFELAAPGKDFAVYSRSVLKLITAASPADGAAGR